VRNPACEFDGLDAPRDFALSVREYLAVLTGDDCSELIAVLVQQVEKRRQHARAADRWRVGPGWESRLRAGDGIADLVIACHGDAARHLATGGVEDLQRSALGLGESPADPVLNDVQGGGGRGGSGG